MKHKIEILTYDFTIHQLNRDEKIPNEILQSEYFWIGKTDKELSIVCDSSFNINNSKSEAGWKALKLKGPFDFSEIGILSAVSKILADAQISIFVISTYNTDYILVKKDKLENAIQALQQNGYYIEQIV